MLSWWEEPERGASQWSSGTSKGSRLGEVTKEVPDSIPPALDTTPDETRKSEPSSALKKEKGLKRIRGRGSEQKSEAGR